MYVLEGSLKKSSENPPKNIQKSLQNHQTIYQKPFKNHPKITQNHTKSIKSAPRDPKKEKLDFVLVKICEMRAKLTPKWSQKQAKI